MKWVLQCCGSHFTVFEVKKKEPVSPTSATEPESKPTLTTDTALEPTHPVESEPATMFFPEPKPATMSILRPEPTVRSIPESAPAAQSIPEPVSLARQLVVHGSRSTTCPHPQTLSSSTCLFCYLDDPVPSGDLPTPLVLFSLLAPSSPLSLPSPLVPYSSSAPPSLLALFSSTLGFLIPSSAL